MLLVSITKSGKSPCG